MRECDGEMETEERLMCRERERESEGKGGGRGQSCASPKRLAGSAVFFAVG